MIAKEGWQYVLSSPLRHIHRGIRKIESFVPIYGVRGTLKIIARNVLWVETVYRLEKDLQIPESKVEPQIPIVVIMFGDLDLSEWEGREQVQQIRGHYGLSQFRERLDRGDLLFSAYWESKFVGFVWLEFPPGVDAGYGLKNDEAYIYDSWTFEPYRGKRVSPTIQQTIFNYLRKKRPDIRHVITHVATWNKASLAGDQRAGYRITSRELSIVFWGYHRKFKLNVGRQPPGRVSTV